MLGDWVGNLVPLWDPGLLAAGFQRVSCGGAHRYGVIAHLKRHPCIQDFLARYPEQASAVTVNWQLFGYRGLRLSQRTEVGQVRPLCAERACDQQPVCQIDRKGDERVLAHTASLKPD